MRFIFVAALVLFPLLVSTSEAQQWNSHLDALIERPGTKVVVGREKDGAEIREIHLLSGVSFFETRRGSKESSYSVDRSGLNAVMCIWQLYVDLRTAMDTCPSSADESLKTELDDAINRINEFIVDNSISLITKANVETSVEKRVQSAWKRHRKAKRKAENQRTNVPKAPCLSRFGARLL